MVFIFWLYQSRVCRILRYMLSISSIGIVEVEYDLQRAEKEDHEIKMREVQKVEELRKEKEAAGK